MMVISLEYLGKTITEILEAVISLDEFEEICDEFTNKIFMRDNQESNEG